MFTGIVEETGIVNSIKHTHKISVLELSAKKVIDGTKLGDSINVNGVCLTVTLINKNIMKFDIMGETLDKTNLKYLRKGSTVNLERALAANSRIGGHYVTGHIDCVSKVLKSKQTKNFWELEIEKNKDISDYLVNKGSISVNGVSLTIGNVSGSSILLYLIPHTLKNTNLNLIKPNDLVNIEADILGKYVKIGSNTKKSLDRDFLKEHGFN